MSGLRVERDGPVLRITLARPERRNAFDAELIAELTEAFGNVGDARAVLLGGDGKAFCAGADVEWQRASIDLTYEQNVEDALRLYRMLAAVDACPAPVVARIQGYCLGGGCGLAACCDIAVCGDDAIFGFSEVKLGIIPAVISPFVLAKVGSGAARRYFLTGERFGPEVSQVAPGLDGVVEGVVDELLTSGPAAVREAKHLVRPEPPDGLELAELAARMRTSDEGQEGLRAFLDKRAATWRSEGSS
jgi:methylglutaconyl-CoA hydratase